MPSSNEALKEFANKVFKIFCRILKPVLRARLPCASNASHDEKVAPWEASRGLCWRKPRKLQMIKYHEAFLKGYLELLLFRQQYGIIKVPKQINKSLNEWLHNQRTLIGEYKKQKVFYNNLLNTKSQVEPLTKSLTLEFGFIITYYFLVRSTSTACCENFSSSVTVMNTCDSRFKLQLTLEVRPRPTIWNENKS